MSIVVFHGEFLSRGLDFKPVESHGVVVPQFPLIRCGPRCDDFSQGQHPLAIRCAPQAHGPIAAEDDAIRAERVQAVVDNRSQGGGRSLLRCAGNHA